jgi:hypothetical protein
MRAWAALALVLPLALVACAPIPVDRAEDACFEDARLAAAPRGFVGLGAGSEGVSGKLSVTVTSDYLQGRDPAQVYESCVFRKSGQMPRRPLYDRPDWKG